MIPPATLQMLVENSIKHGLRDKASGGIIQLTLKRAGDLAVVQLRDNGAGISPEVLDTRRTADHRRGDGKRHLQYQSAFNQHVWQGGQTHRRKSCRGRMQHILQHPLQSIGRSRYREAN